MNQETNIANIPQPQEQIAPVLPEAPTLEALGHLATGLEKVDESANSWQPGWQPKLDLEALPAVGTPDKSNNVPVKEADEDRIPVPVIANSQAIAAQAKIDSLNHAAYPGYEEPKRGRHAF